VQKQRRNLRNALLTARAQAQSDFQKGFRGCFDNDQCVSNCQASLTTCTDGTAQAPGPNPQKAACNNAVDEQDSITSCAEKFNDAIEACANIPATNDRVADAQAQLACAQQARLDRFACSQACASAVQKALDDCNTSFSDCTERCG